MGRRSSVVRKAVVPGRKRKPQPQSSRTLEDNEAVRVAIRRHLTRVSVHNFNLARLRAQVHEEEMIDVLYSMAVDVLMPAELRRLCALNVLEQARGKIGPQVHDGATINPSDPALDGTDRLVGDQIEAARVAAAEMSLIHKWSNVPIEQWPEEVKRLLGPDMGAAFTDVVEEAAD